ncbi:armadillo-type protein [Schizophyllum amplum]|uniref:Armadillo-type protein n=1 Tax=Schizophyllum amplum TaxID=97359 RepID=A0A550CIN7_9AGAR|nr:armadillo-type protein [Auriculariopsis ampla]
MADLPTLLRASLDPSTRKQAEQNLTEVSAQQGFLTSLLRLVLEPAQDRAVRLSGSVYLKNVIKMRWDEDVNALPEGDKTALRSELVPAMIALSNPSDKAIRAQVAESVSLVAELDFPHQWSDLMDQLVLSLSRTDYNINAAVFETAHSIFRPWRSQVRSDELFTVINFVYEKFMAPWLGMFRQTATLLLSNPSPEPSITTPVSNLKLVAQTMLLLLEIFYDFTCHDLPPTLEDAHAEFFAPGTGYLHAFMTWSPPELATDPDDTTPSLPSQIKAAVLEIAELYIKLFPDALSTSQSVAAFVQEVWTLIGSNSLPSLGDDPLVAQSLRFISVAIRSGLYRDLFASKDTISQLIQGVVVPNVALREHEVEQFEDDPMEYIRQDLALASTDVSTRRQAAADVIQALVSSGFDAETTEIVGEWIRKGLQEYASNKENWQAKDGAVYSFTAVATKGSTTQHGVTSTNPRVNVIEFFSNNVFQDLQAAAGTVNPILQVDAIKFLYTFRNQLTKPQLISVLPLLVHHLGSDNYVTYTYAAITIDRILFIKQGNQLLFAQADIHDFAADMINALLKKVEAGGTPEKVAENQHLMRCIMRIILTARQSLIPHYEQILARLVAILGVIAKNPSNPHFDQYIFESLAGLLRFVVAGNRSTIANFEAALFGPFTFIIQNEIEQYVPYVFQILGQMLEAHPEGVPEAYKSLLSLLFTPATWQQKGSIPGLVKLLRAFLARDAKGMFAAGQIASVLAVVQQRLIPSKLNDAWGFQLLEGVIRYVPPADLQQYIKPVILTLLQRMQTSKTEIYASRFAYFFLFSMALNVEGLTPDFIMGAVEQIQPQLWSNLLTSFIITQTPKMPPKDRKVAAIGMCRMLTESQIMLQPPAVQQWPRAFDELVKLFSEPQHLQKSKTDEDPDAGITEVDYEEQTAGYQAAYSKLAASETSEPDPVGYVNDVQTFVGTQLVKLSGQAGQATVRQMLMATGPPSQAFVQKLAAAGYNV